MERLVLCTTNAGKIVELRALLAGVTEVVSLSDVGLAGGWEETADTFAGNALLKARSAYAACGVPCLGDDSGLEVDALGGAPGVRSARFAGEPADDRANVALLLHRMRGVKERSARFVTVLALVGAGSERIYTGLVAGAITHSPRGTMGFGYDPIFQPFGEVHTFAELTMEVKNRMGHRAAAVKALLADMVAPTKEVSH
jgi:XTP/dITP diphosphohydrolase